MLLVLSSLVWLACVAAGLECRPQGPIYPRPNLAASATFQAAAGNLTAVLGAAVNGTIKAGWEINSTTISVALVSWDQSSPGAPLWEFHHLAANSWLGTKQLDRNSQYQIGSISKAITDAILIQSGLNLDDPITKYLPSLGGAPSLIPWESITLRALASHLAGIPPNYGYSEYFYLRSYFETLGLPRLNYTDYLMCDVFGLNLGCSRSQYVVGLKTAHPVAPPMQKPVYSNVAFTLLMYAVGLSTGRSYPQLLYEFITGPLGMKNTYPSPGVFNTAAVPPVSNSWGFYFGDATPGGGLVSTLADLSIFVHSILTYSIFETPATVREWLQPRSFAGSRHSFFGMPWEIFRPPPEAIFPKYDPATESGGHTLTINTKDGAAYGYRARISMIEEYGVGLVLLAAGDSAAVTSINDAMLRTLIPAVDEAAREQTKNMGYVGTFANNCSSPSFNATITMDGKSLILDALSRGSADIIASLSDIFVITYGRLIPNYFPGPILRLYPAEISTQSVLRGRTVTREDWRFVWDVTRHADSDLPGQGISAYDCLAWEAVDWVYYGSQAVDRVVFVKDAATGEVLGLEVPFLRNGGTESGSCSEDLEFLLRDMGPKADGAAEA